MTDLERAQELAHRLEGAAAPTIIREFSAALAAVREEERQRWLECASVDATMEGPRLKGWNRSSLDRRWQDLIARAQAAYEAMTPEQQKAHDEAQRESFVRGNIELDRMEREERMTTRIKPPTA